MKKIILFVFNGDPMCFIHVLLNVLDMKEKGDNGKIVIEGAATKLIEDLVKPENPLHKLWSKVVDSGLVEGVCKACATKMGTLAIAEKEGLTLLQDMSGHPSMAAYMKDGFEIITF